MPQGSLDPKIRFLGQKVCFSHTKVNTGDTLSVFQEFFLQPIIKDQSNILVINLFIQLFHNLVKTINRGLYITFIDLTKAFDQNHV